MGSSQRNRTRPLPAGRSSGDLEAGCGGILGDAVGELTSAVCVLNVPSRTIRNTRTSRREARKRNLTQGQETS